MFQTTNQYIFFMIYLYGGFLKWGYPKKSSISRNPHDFPSTNKSFISRCLDTPTNFPWIFHHKPTSELGDPPWLWKAPRPGDLEQPIQSWFFGRRAFSKTMNHCWWTSSAPASRCSKMPQFLGGQSPFTIIVMMYIYICISWYIYQTKNSNWNYADSNFA